MKFNICAQSDGARAGEIEINGYKVETPMFMPVGTHGAVKGVSPLELSELGCGTILANTYHMYLRPGDELVRDLGGLHEFMGYKTGPILTDSGGFQVFSLGERGMTGSSKKALRKVSEEGIEFVSHLDGSRHMFTPEKSILVQENLGADIIMAFDQPVYGLSASKDIWEAMERSMRWLKRSVDAHTKPDQALFAIVQGGTDKKAHTYSANYVAEMDLPGNAIGGLSVGEGKDEMWEAVSSINNILPENKPHYFMGLGEPRDLVDAVLRGVDMFDCVSPSRLARHGSIWDIEGTSEAVEAFWSLDTEYILKSKSKLKFVRKNLRNASFATDQETFRFGGLPKATLRHYIVESEMLGFRYLTQHNIAILINITKHLRVAIKLDRVGELAKQFN